MEHIEQFTENLVKKEMNFEIGRNSFGYVYPQGNVTDIQLLSDLLKKAGGKPKCCEIYDFPISNTNKKAQPEFIIRFDDIGDTIILIECKKSVKKHRSESLNKPNDYAVDGVLYYAKYLKAEYNVIAIAVSGTVKDKALIDVYYWNKQSNNYLYQEKYHNLFLTPENYLKGYRGEKISKSYSLEEIKETAIDFHHKLREIKISEIEKPILIAGILIGLEDKGFINDYNQISSFESLFSLLESAISKILKKSDIKEENISYILNTVNGIKNNPKLKEIALAQDGSLKWYINQLEMKIKPMMSNADYALDALGVFYHEFIKYSGGDGKGLGIVLTPQHLTEFMCDLANIDSNSCVIDICCGSASFLVTAMHKMFGMERDPQKLDDIRASSLFGIELDQSLHMLAIANMIVRKDGKSNIIHGDCFNQEIIEELKQKSKKPFTVGLLNPPYSQKDKEELEFVEKALSLLAPNGTAVVVVPMSCAIGTKFKSVRKRLFEKHTLKAVFSMPDDIFYPTATNVCVMVWEAHKKHNPKVATFFGYYKNDGFVKRKKLGRVSTSSWKDIKEKWLEIYRNSEVVDGLSAKKSVTHSDEWLAEAYMNTDYSVINNHIFDEMVRRYLSYLVKFGLTNLSRNYSDKLDYIPLDSTNWQPFKITKYFNYERGKRLTKENRIIGVDGIPLVTAGEGDLGVKEFISNDDQIRFEKAITIDMFCNSYTHILPFCCDDNVIVLTPKEDVKDIDRFTMLFINVVIELDKYRYQYGRQYRKKNLLNHEIKLPSVNGEPNWKWMSDYIKQFHFSDYI